MSAPPLTPPQVGNPASAAYLTAQLYNPIAWVYSAFPMYKYKTINTDRSSTTLTSDTDMTVTLPPNSACLIEMHLFYAALDVARFRTGWSVPADATGSRSAVGADQGVILSSTSAGGTQRSGVHAYSTICTYGTRDHATNLCSAEETAVLSTVTGGTVSLQWAQVTLNATPARLGVGSWMRATRLDVF